MNNPQAELVKTKVRDYWNSQSCDTQVAQSTKFSKDYFEEIERFRYFDQPYIHSFAQFSRYHGKRILEVGFGAGTDFIQWLRAGAVATGIDLTPEALSHLRHRIQVYQLPEPERIMVADAENLPLETGTFDLGYSFGVLHHTPDTVKAIHEVVRVLRPGGELKIMLYNRPSIFGLNRWVKHGLLKGRPWRSLRWIFANHVESPDTKAYTRAELARILSSLPLENIEVRTEITAADYLSASAFPPLNWLYRLAILLAGWRYPWLPSDYVGRVTDAPEWGPPTKSSRDPQKIVFTGNRWGFFHCIYARKKGA